MLRDRGWASSLPQMPSGHWKNKESASSFGCSSLKENTGTLPKQKTLNEQRGATQPPSWAQPRILRPSSKAGPSKSSATCPKTSSAQLCRREGNVPLGKINPLERHRTNAHFVRQREKHHGYQIHCPVSRFDEKKGREPKIKTSTAKQKTGIGKARNDINESKKPATASKCLRMSQFGNWTHKT